METGIYETLINNALQVKLKNIPTYKYFVSSKPLDNEEAAKVLSEYLSDVIRYALKEIKGEDKLNRQLEFCNGVLMYVQENLDLNLSDSLVDIEGQILMAVLSKIGKTDIQIKEELQRKLPLSGLTSSHLFTGSHKDISIDTEIEKDIHSSDKIQWIVSFIRWSGLRIFEKALREFTDRPDAQLKIITTTYMGATEARALEFLSQLPNTVIKISYQTKVERLHAKSYIFERESGFDTAYIGSSNLSYSALTKGLEWNMRVTSQENPHILDKAKATFDYYWNNIDFEDFELGGVDKFKKAIKQERKRDGKEITLSYFEIHPYPFQKEILEKLTIERAIHNRKRNLIVAATGTGKTVISAFDFKQFQSLMEGNANILFVAHRKEILEQAIGTYRMILGRDVQDFGELWVDKYQPDGTDLRNLFISVQTLNANKELFQARVDPGYYNYIVIDEAHHSKADSYRFIFDHFQPEILVGLTATPERMDGNSLLPDFDNRISAEIRLPDALGLKLLSPFQYFCITDDSVDLQSIRWAQGGYDLGELTHALSAKVRVKLIIDAIKHYLSDPFSCKALCFCTTKQHAIYMDQAFKLAGLKSTVLVSGGDKKSDEERDRIRQKLVKNKVNYVFVVDIFNEGVDIPEVDTVLFLRPTESLTVFLQQLGRGLRISEGKECLTVLDFVSQAHKQYNFASRFRALIGKSKQNLHDEIEQGFPHLPGGCSIKMERQAQAYILDNIKNAIFDARRIRREIAEFRQHTSQPLTLHNFLEYHQLDIRAIYSGNKYWTALKREAGAMSFEEEGRHALIARGLKRLLFIDSTSYLRFIQKTISNNFEVSPSSTDEESFALMFYYDIWQKSVKDLDFKDVFGGIKELANYPVLVNELSEILEVLYENLNHATKEIDFDFDNVLDLHARYSRDQILCAFGKTTAHKVFPSQEGVVRLPEIHAELFLVTLNKSDKDFSPTTQYEDYAISEKIFHWQSQNLTSPQSPVGLSYINHRDSGKNHLLFVRENKKDGYRFTEPYIFLGPVNYISHRGSKPMSINWELKHEMPPGLFKTAAKMAAG